LRVNQSTLVGEGRAKELMKLDPLNANKRRQRRRRRWQQNRSASSSPLDAHQVLRLLIGPPLSPSPSLLYNTVCRALNKLDGRIYIALPQHGGGNARHWLPKKEEGNRS